MSSKKILVFLFTIFLFFISTQKVNAAFSFNIDSVVPASVESKDSELVVNLSLTDLPAGDNYFRVGFKEGNTYVGYIKNNNGDWVKLRSLSDGCIDYFKVSENTSSVILNLKIGSDVEVSNGSILLKAHRYTSSCASNIGSNEYLININLPTPTPSPTSAPTSEPTNVPATAAPTAIPTVKPTPTKSPTPKASPTPTEEAEEITKLDGLTEAPGLSIDSDKSPTPIGIVAGTSIKKKSPILSIILISLGVLSLGYCGYLIYNQKHAIR